MLWASERGRHFRFAIALRCNQLGLDKENTAGEIGASEVGISEVGPGEIGQPQVGASEVSSDEICPSQAGASEIGAPKSGPDEISPSQILFGPDFCSRKFARAQKQAIDVSLVRSHIQFQELIRTVVRQAFGLCEREAKFIMERVG